MLLTVKDVMADYQISKSKVYRMIKAGELPCIKVGSHYRFIPEELDRLWKRKREVKL